MKYLILSCVVFFTLCAGALAEKDIEGKSSDPASQTVVFEAAGGPGERAIKTGPVKNRYPDDGGLDDAGTMPQDESYDDNTGLPNYVPSDTYGEVDD
jgi:hypothetical protein